MKTPFQSDPVRDRRADPVSRLHVPSQEGNITRWLTLALFGAEGLTVGLALLIYRIEGKSDVGEFLVSRPGILCLAAVAALLGLVGMILRLSRQLIKSGSRQWLFGFVTNGLVIVTLVLVGEVGLRALTIHTNTEERIAGRLLYPRQWNVTAANFRAILERTETQTPFWVADEDLGWTIGQNRQSADGLYFSSAEGLRSSRVGVSFQGEPSDCRIAMIGDSFTFGEEVVNEDSWVYLLAQSLKGRCQVLNFAVGGYGVDQMYLRYMRDVRPWHPDLVVLAFVNHDVVRTLSVYSFLLFPGGETPFAKPRFVLRDNALMQINRPLITAREVFGKSSIRDLPFIEYDANYRETEWDRPRWNLFSHSYLFRLLVSLYPLHERERPEISERVLQEVNTELFRSFLTNVATAGAQSLVVYLPSVDEVPDRLPWVPIGPKILRDAKIPHLNIRDCMAEGYKPGMFMPEGRGQHYSPHGNQVAARCLIEPVRSLIDKRSVS